MYIFMGTLKIHHEPILVGEIMKMSPVIAARQIASAVLRVTKKPDRYLPPVLSIA